MGDRFLVTGATGQLGGYLVRELLQSGKQVTGWSGQRASQVLGVATRAVDLAVLDQVTRAFRDAAPTTVIHAAAIASVGDCARDPERAAAVNVRGTRLLAELAASAKCRLVYVSTDLVFDGEGRGYTEFDPPAPLSEYGRTKLGGEHAVREFANTLVIRVSLLFGQSLTGRCSFFTELVDSLRTGKRSRLHFDEFRTPLGLPAAARAIAQVADAELAGLLHIGGPERMSRLEMGQRLARYLGVDAAGIEAVSRATAPGEPRPRDTSLDSSKWRGLFPNAPWLGFEGSLSAMGIR